MPYISFNYRELHRLKEAVFAPHMVNAGKRLLWGGALRERQFKVLNCTIKNLYFQVHSPFGEKPCEPYVQGFAAAP